MALPNPNPGGAATAATKVVYFPAGQGGSGGSGKPPPPTKAATTLVSLTQDLIIIQKNVLNMLNIIDFRLVKFFDEQDEQRTAKQTGGAVGGTDLNFKDILSKAGGFGNILGAALIAYVFDLDKYIRTAFIGSKVFGPLVKGVSSTFTKLGNVFTKLFNTKAFTTAVRPFTTAFQNFMAGFRNVGKSIGAIKAPLSIKDFTTVFGKIGATIKTIITPFTTAFGKIGSTIGSIVKPFMTGFKTVSGILGRILSPIGSIFKGIGGIFSSIFKALSPFIRIAGNFMKAIPIVGQIMMLIFGVFDFVKGFIKGFSEGGILGGLKEGAMELVRGFLTKPLDLLTEGIAYLMGFFGFDNIKASIDEFLKGGGFTGMFNDMMAALGKAFDKVVQFFKDLFNDPIATLKSVATNIGNFAMDIFKPIGDAFTKVKDYILGLLGFGDDGGYEETSAGGGSFNLSEMFGDLDFSFLSPTKIASQLGEMLNNALQGFAESLDKSKFPGTDTLGEMISKTGVGIAEFLGADNIQQYNVSEGKMETLKGSMSGGAGEGTAANEMSKDVAARKEAGGMTAVDASTKVGDTINQTSKTEVKGGKVAARSTDNPAAGKRAR